MGAASAFVVEATAEALAYAATPESAYLAAAGTLGSRAQVEAELDGVLLMIRSFYAMEPDEAMQHIGSMSARLSELGVLLHRVESRDRTYKQIRTMQVDKILGELDRQFKIHSRLVEVRRQDLEKLR